MSRPNPHFVCRETWSDKPPVGVAWTEHSLSLKSAIDRAAARLGGCDRLICGRLALHKLLALPWGQPVHTTWWHDTYSANLQLSAEVWVPIFEDRVFLATLSDPDQWNVWVCHNQDVGLIEIRHEATS